METSAIQIDSDQVSPTQIDFHEKCLLQDNFSQIDTSEIAIASSISSEQFLRSYNSTSFDLVNNLTANLNADETEIINPSSVEYNPETNTATLYFNAFNPNKYELIVDDNLTNLDGITLEAPYKVDFTAVSDFSQLVDLEFTNTRSDRKNKTISFDVSLTNQTDYNLSLPLNLVLQPGNNSETAHLTKYTSISDGGAYFIDLSDSLPDGILKPGQSITEETVTIYNPDDLRFEFEPGVYTLPTNNNAPVFTSEPVTTATAGESYVYNVAASDPDGSVIGYLLYDAPEGMSVTQDGQITWNPTTDSPSSAKVSLHVYDSRGGRAIQEFTIAVAGGNNAPVFTAIPSSIKGVEGKPIKLNINAADADGDNLQYWVDNLPPGGNFDRNTNVFSWIPGFEQAGSYENVRFIASDGNEEVSMTTTFLVAQGNQKPTLLPVSDRTFKEGDNIRIQLQASDTENDKLTFSSNLLPGGSFLDPNTGIFEWTPGFFQAGNYEIPFTVSDGKLSTTETFKLQILNVNAAPKFDDLSNWAVAEGQTINFRAFAFDGDNPGFVPQERTADGQLTLIEGSDPTVTYAVEGLPEGATFDADTAIFNWKPSYDKAGEYEVTFTATDNGDGLTPKTATGTVSIKVGDTNRPPTITAISNPIVQRGSIVDLKIYTTDPDGNVLTIKGTGAGGFELPSFVTLADNGDGTANLNIAPGDGNRGDHPVTIIATDELGVTTEYSFIITVDAFNERPLLQHIGNKVAVVGEPIEFTVYVADLDEDNLTFSATGLPDGASLTPSNTYGRATFSWTPTVDDLGSYPITIQVEDSGNGDNSQKLSQEQEFNIVVRNSNTAPVFETGGESTRQLSVMEGETLSFTFIGTDADGDDLTYSANKLPKGAKLDPVTGELTWQPSYRSAGIYEGIEVIVSDGHSSSSQNIKITVTNSNFAPVLTSIPLQSTRENTELTFNLKGNDIDGDALLYSAVSQLPKGAKLDARTGEFKWKPSYGQAGNYTLEFAITDSNGSQDTKQVEIVVANVNRAPSIEVKPTIVALGEELEFTLIGSDPDAETTLTYFVENLPEGATLNSETGVVTWKPSPGQVGDYVVTYQVNDGEDVARKNALIRVETTPTPPKVNLEFTPSFPAIPGQKVFINALADSFTEIEEIKVMINGKELTLDERNRAVYTPNTPGRVEVEVTATDAAGRTATTTEILKVRDPEDNAKPVVAFGLGLNGEAIASATDIKATVSDRNLDEWTLSLQGKGEGEKGKGKVIATGYGEVSNDSVFELDPALYANGFYTLELTATDIKGRTSTTEIIVEVEGNDKTARYQRSDSDLTVDFGGINIDLIRRYDSLQRNQSGSSLDARSLAPALKDTASHNGGAGSHRFGNGWSSSWDFDLETDVEIRGSGNEGIKPLETGTRLYLTAPDGERVGFTFQPVAEEITGLTYYRPAWVADEEVDFTLESADVLLSKAGDRFYDLETAKPYNLEGRSQEAYTLTASDGTRYEVDSEGKLQEQITSNGTRLIYSDSGILNPDTGEMVRFETDGDGRLTTITAPNGESVIYTYDELGNLVGARNLALGESVRYSYGDHGLNLIAGDTGEAIEYFDTPVIKPITTDLGTASSFTGKTVTGNGDNLYSFGIRESEIKSTNTGFVLLSIDLSGTNELPTIEGLTPLGTETTADSSFAMYAIDKEGLNLLSVTGDYELQLGIAGDVNNDNAVDGVDSQLVEAALGKTVGDTGYDMALDVNRDRIIDAEDLQILGSNYGFRYNQAPVVTDGEALTHEDLSVEIPLADLASDPEGERVFFKTKDVENGTVSFSADGQTIIFKPDVGYTGTASFKLFADDGYAVSKASIVEINVSDAPLTSLDFVERNLGLEVGEQFELQVIADFADQEDVIVPGDYLTWSSENQGVASISARGVVIGVSNGDSIINAQRDKFTAVTATNVGKSITPTTEAELYENIAEEYGLEVFPKAASIAPGEVIPLDVTAGQSADRPDLSSYESGTRYFVSNPEIAVMSSNGMLLALKEGVVDVTVIHGGSEFVIPVKVEDPHLGNTATLDAAGGMLKNEDDYQVMVAPEALAEETTVTINSLAESELELPVPDYVSLIGAFSLDIGSQAAKTPLQFALSAPENYSENDLFLVLRQGQLPNAETGGWSPSWLIEDFATVEADGMLRTGSETSKMPGIFAGNGVNNFIVVSMTVPDELLNSFTPDTPETAANLSASLLTENNETSSNSSILSAALEAENSNFNPTGINDTYTVNEDDYLVVSAAEGVLANDSDLEGNRLTASLNLPPSHGEISLGADGAFTYIPEANFNGSDSFEYKVTDGLGGENIGVVTITVNPVNDPPVASNNFFFAEMNQVLEADLTRNLLGNDFDVDGDPLTITHLQPEHGSVTVNSNGTFIYTPDDNYVGPDKFKYKITDGVSESTANVNLQVQIPRAQDSILAPFLQGGYSTAMFALSTVSAIAFPGSGLGMMMTGFNVAMGIAASTAVPLMVLADFLARRNQILNTYAIDETGNFVTTPLNIEYNTDNLPSKIGRPVNQPVSPQISPAKVAPSLDKVEVTFDESTLNQYGPVIYVEGSNILASTNISNLGDNFADLKIEIADGKVNEGKPIVQQATVIPSLSQELANNRQRVAIQIPKDVSIGDASIKIIRPNEVLDLPGTSTKTIEVPSLPIQFPRTELNYEFTVARDSDDVIVTSRDNGAIVARIKLPENGSPVAAALNPDSTRYYVPLRNIGEVAVVSTLTLNPIDFAPDTPEVDSIKLPTGAAPEQIAIAPNGQYAYVSDMDNQSIYILDITPGSEDYNHLVDTIAVGGASGSRLRKVAISADGKVLFATQSTNFTASNSQSRIVAININPEDAGTDQYHQVIGTLADIPEKVFGIRSVPNTNQMGVTFRRTRENQGGFAFLNYQYNTPGEPASGIQLSLGKVESVAMGSNLVGAWDPYDIVVDTFEYEDPSYPTGKKTKTLAFVGGFNGGALPSIAFNGPRELNDVTSATVLVLTVDEAPNGNYTFKEKASFLTPKLMGHITDLEVVEREVLTAPDAGLPLVKDKQKELIVTYPGKQQTITFDPGEIAKKLDEAELNPELKEKLKKTPIDLEEPKVRKRTRRLEDLADGASGLETIIDETLEIAKEYWDRRAKEQAEEALQEIEDKVPGRAWDIVLPLPNPVKPIPSFVDLKPIGDRIINSDDLIAELQPVEETETFIQPGVLDLIEWEYEESLDEEQEVQKIVLFISTSPDGEGLTPEDGEFVDWDNVDENSSIFTKRNILGKQVTDFNPNRVLTAEGTLIENGIIWESLGGRDFNNFEVEGMDNAFPVGDYLNLTPGRYYYKIWTKQGNGQIIEHDPSSFEWYPTVERKIIKPDDDTALQPAPPFPSITVITPDAYKNDPNSFIKAHNLGLNIANKIDRSTAEDGYVLRYEPLTGDWISVDGEEIALEDLDRNKPLVLITDWSEDSQDDKYNSGTAEAAADSFFSSLIQLDQEYLGGSIGLSGNIYDPNGDLIYNPGGLLNSPFHFVSFGAGAVVNTEIIQRIGAAFPKQDENNNDTRFVNTFPDLQMTTIEPNQGDEFEPEITVWDNVTFADNYYQNATEPFSEVLDKADINIPLGANDFSLTRAGFTGSPLENGNISKNSNIRAVAWYKGTANINEHETFIDYPILRRLGDFSQPDFSAPDTAPWYVAEHELGGQIIEDEFRNGQWEGNGTGWFYSMLGNGYFKRPEPIEGKRSVAEDNTALDKQRGDFAVPTLFNGNFDVIAQQLDTQPIPGWSLHSNDENQNSTLLQGALKKWDEISSLANHRTKLGYNPANPDYTLELSGGESIVHNRFVVPDWGTLRFDLHTPSLLGGDLDVFIKGDAVGYESFNELQSIDLSPATGRGRQYENDLYKIGYGTSGFETFHINLPSSLRGKSVELKFELQGFKTVYLDNVFFQSEHLRFGNPTEARSAEPIVPDANNLLLEKPQYSLSYNETAKTPNWVSWQLNKAWLGNTRRYNYFLIDPILPNGLTRIRTQDYDNSGYDRGHMLPSSQRNRNKKDNIATFLMTNILPQTVDNNQFFTTFPSPNPDLRSAWYNFEKYTKDLANDGRELYLVAGGYDFNFNVQPQVISNADPAQSTRRGGLTTPSILDSRGIQIPSWTWKTAVVLDRPGLGIEDVSATTPTHAIITPNTPEPTLTEFNNGGVQHPLDTIIPLDSPRSNITSQAQWRNWETWRVTVDQLEDLLRTTPGLSTFDLMPEVRQNIQNSIEASLSPVVSVPNFPPEEDDSDSSVEGEDNGDEPLSSLLLGTENQPLTGLIFNGVRSFQESSIGQSGVTEESTFVPSTFVFSSSHISPSQINSSHVSPAKVGIPEIGSNQLGTFKDRTTQISITETNFGQVGKPKTRSNKFSATESTSTHIIGTEVSPTKISFGKVDSVDSLSDRIVLFPSSSPAQVSISEFNSKELFIPSSIASEEFISSNFHDLTPQIINVLNNTATNIWSDLLQTETQLDIDFQITDLPTGQLAEATITGFDDSGVPNAGTILIDHDANGVGWFIDSTPLESSEFGVQNSETYLLAAADSEANGKYDLLTAVLHELAHLYGFIDGYAGYSDRLETKNGTTKFIGDDFTTTLNGEHLDKEAHPHDLMNTHLAPGVRKLPSELNVQILQAILADEDGGTRRLGDGEKLDAALTSDPLLAIANGDFSISDTTTDSFAWDTRGKSGIESGQAILTEDSPFLSNFTQTFTVPEDAKTIQFKLIGAELGASELAPPDAFEVALLDANTNQPLTTTSNGLTETDSLLNIQNDGTAYFSNNVRINGTTSGEMIDLDKSRTITIDISHLTPGRDATLYFDLLGFGAADSRVVIDDVILSDQNLLPPVTTDDTATTTQRQPVVIDILNNDRDEDGTLAVNSVQIQTEPHYGTVTVNNDGTVSYTSEDRTIGDDTFTYVVQDSDGQISEPATVNVTVENAIPEITEIQIPNTITEGDTTTFTALASDPGNDELTYSWNFGDGKTATSLDTTHTYVQDGEYILTVTVDDGKGGITTSSLTVTVNNVAPMIERIDNKISNEGQEVQFDFSFKDPGVLDTHTVTWDFGDGSKILEVNSDTLSISHIYTNNGIYTATITVTDSNGAIATQDITVTVENLAPIIESVTGDTEISEGDTANFKAVASDPGNDTLTYTWDFGDGETDTGMNVSHTFISNGNYTVTLTVQDSDGASTSQTLDVTVNNVAPVIESITADSEINEGDTASFNALTRDAGNDELTLTWDFADGSEQLTVNESDLPVSHQYADNGNYTVTLTVTDTSGDNTSSTHQITVNNTAPVITSLTDDLLINEGSRVNLSAFATDAGDDELTYAWDFGDGTNTVMGENVEHIFVDNGLYEATVTVTDDDGASTSSSLTITVNNVAPIIDPWLDETATEGDTVEFNLSFKDPGSLDTHTLTWDFGDGNKLLTTNGDETSVSHIYTDNGVYTARVIVTDSNGASSTNTMTVTVNNAAPALASLTGDTNIDEGSTANFSITAKDPGDDTLTYTWDFGDGETATGKDVSHIFSQNGTYTVTATVTDDDGASTSSTMEVAVNNLAPVIESITGDTEIQEGDTASFNALAIDSGKDTLTYAWNFGDGSETVTGNEVTHVFADNGNYTVELTVTDSDGSSTSQTLDVKVNNVAPIITEANGNTQINEGDTANFNALAIDPGKDTLTYTWTLEDGTELRDQNVNYTFAEDGEYNVNLTVSDSDGASTSQTLVITVSNVAPIISELEDQTSDEGQTVEFEGNFQDPGILDTHTVEWHFGDGNNAENTLNPTHVYTDNGEYDASLTITDDEGAGTTIGFKVIVNNVAPTITEIVGNNSVDEGSLTTFLAVTTDPGSDELIYTWNFGDGSELLVSPDPLTPIPHIYQDNGNYTVDVMVTDDDGATDSQTFEITVNNVNPTIESVTGDTEINEGDTATFEAFAKDPGDDTLSYTWNFGDNSESVTGENSSHLYQDNGEYTVTLTVQDDDGGVTIQTLTVTVNNVAPIIEYLTGDTQIQEGSTANFNAGVIDPGNDELTYIWNFGDGSESVTDSIGIISHTYTNNGEYTVNFTVKDDDGGQTSSSIVVTVDNVAPTITDIAYSPVHEGKSTKFTATAKDPGNDTLTYTWNFGDGSETVEGAIVNHLYTDDGFYTATLTVRDSDGGVTTSNFMIAVRQVFNLKAEGKVRINGSSDLEREILNPNDDTRIYAGAGFTINGNQTLPVQRDQAGNPILQRSHGGQLEVTSRERALQNNKPVLIERAITVGPNYTESNANAIRDKYVGVIPPQVIEKLVVNVPSHQSLIEQELITSKVNFNPQSYRLNNANQWASVFPNSGTTDNPTVVRVKLGSLNIPTGVSLNNTVIIVERGDINFNGNGHNLDSVVLIASKGSINLAAIYSNNSAIFAANAININRHAKFSGNTTIATGDNNSNLNFDGATSTLDAYSHLKVISQGNIIYNSSNATYGEFTAAKNFTANGRTDLIGSIQAKGDIIINGGISMASTFNSGILTYYNHTGNIIYHFLKKENNGFNSNFYTSSALEKDVVISSFNNYQYQGESFISSGSIIEGGADVYRFFNTQTATHFYTTNETERDFILSSLSHFSYEGIAFTAYSTRLENSLPVYRFYDSNKGIHFFTNDEASMISLRRNAQYNYEGIAYYVIPV
ncbi:DNA/RNA non-specific endonuclease [Chondrocystis sp. NIES-4102]|nr:DNA/RNA non-specific endonuclease [Chondrocystis sp. NIES-4102]